MAAISARCLRSFAKAASISIGKSGISSGGLSKSRTLSSLVSRSLPVLKDSGLLQRIARDNMAKNLARRHTRLSAAVNQLMLVIAMDMNVEGEGTGDELGINVISEDDDILRI